MKLLHNRIFKIVLIALIVIGVGALLIRWDDNYVRTTDAKDKASATALGLKVSKQKCVQAHVSQAICDTLEVSGADDAAEYGTQYAWQISFQDPKDKYYASTVEVTFDSKDRPHIAEYDLDSVQ